MLFCPHFVEDLFFHHRGSAEAWHQGMPERLVSEPLAAVALQMAVHHLKVCCRPSQLHCHRTVCCLHAGFCPCVLLYCCNQGAGLSAHVPCMA